MGADGGSKPKRKEIVKKQKIYKKRNKFNYKTCSLTMKKLKNPIVICKKGRLFNKLSILEHLTTNSLPSWLKYIKHLSDIFEVIFTKIDQESIICPITRIEMNGINKFSVIIPCGHCISDKAIELTPIEECPVCSINFNKIIKLYKRRRSHQRRSQRKILKITSN